MIANGSSPSETPVVGAKRADGDDFPRLKILYHHRTRSRDGQYVHIRELVGALEALGHSVTVIEPPGSGLLAFGASPARVDLVRKVVPKFIHELLELGYSLLEYRRLSRVARHLQPDVFYQRSGILMLSGIWLSRRYRMPFLLEVNSPLALERRRYGGLALPGLANWAERRLWQAADRVLAVTRVLARQVVAAGVPTARVEVIANGVDPCRFTPLERDDAKRKLGLEGRLVLGFTGFVREWHRSEQLLEILSSPSAPRNAHFLLVGDGPVRSALEEKASQLGVRDRLSITGVVPRDRVPEHIAAFDIALQPHVVPYASPLKLFEYMASGRAIVAPDTPNIREILTHEFDALLFNQETQGTFTAAVLRLARDAGLRVRLESNARRTIRDRRLTWRDNAIRVASLAEQLRTNSSNWSSSLDASKNSTGDTHLDDDRERKIE